MSVLSKAETLYLQGRKQVSKSYEYNIKSTLKKKLSRLLNIDLPLLSSLFPNLDLTKFSKNQNKDKELVDLTKNGKISNPILFLNQHYNEKLDFITQNTIEKHRTPSQSNSKEENEQLYIKSKKKINNYSTRAGGLAWLRYRLDMAGVVGSNPTRPI